MNKITHIMSASLIAGLGLLAINNNTAFAATKSHKHKKIKTTKIKLQTNNNGFTAYQANNQISNYQPTTNTTTPAQTTATQNPTNQNPSIVMSSIANTAKQYLGIQYVYGGTNPNGFDCSGFTQYVYQQAKNKSLPRTAQDQYNVATKISEMQAKSGDLVFFGSNNNISHVGIYLGNGKMIDAQDQGVIIENIHVSWWNLIGFGHI